MSNAVNLSLVGSRILFWWDANRVDLPWRYNRDPYAIWVAEVMLQQTQITTVIPYFERWMARFPTVRVLASASLDEILKMWEGLGYYSRARNLHAATQTIVTEFDGKIPDTVEQLMKLKGVGRYTAGAIASIAFNQPVPVVDGNIIRVLSRLLDLEEDVTASSTKEYLWQVAGDLVPLQRPGDFNQALMELGQSVCSKTKPECSKCPINDLCLALQHGTQLERPVRPARRQTPHYDVAAAVIFDEDDRLLITKRPLNGLLGGLWEFPGGKKEDGETLVDALRREICEELAIEIKIGKRLVTIEHAYTHFRITLHAYEARHLHGKPRHLGVADHAWIRPDDLKRYAFAVTDRKIIDHLWSEGLLQPDR